LSSYVDNESVKAVDVVYAKLEGLMSCFGVTAGLLPAGVKASKNAYEPDVCIFEPSRPYMVDVLTKLALKAQVYDAMITSLIAEHAMRMTAMKNATDNAKRLQDELKLTYNRARQAAITQEISEIINASESVS
jgi:F-type H+-transporting ATPase subunit gamma